MSNTKHTPGPWLINLLVKRNALGKPETKIFTNRVGKLQNIICNVFGKDIPECESNAKLIAAAPELLEALQSAWKDSIDTDSNCQMKPETTMKILAAIKKATE